MTLEVKFKEEDEIHFLHNNKHCKSIVRGFKYERRPVKRKGVNGPVEYTDEVTYLCNQEPDTTVFVMVSEDKAYPTKEALIQSL